MAAEQVAEIFLQTHGLQLVERNFRRRFGEIDLIMLDQDSLVFVEVRKRSSSRFVDAAESIDWRKQRKLLRTAEAYLQQNFWHGPCRFDVVVLDKNDTVEWLQDAFQA